MALHCRPTHAPTHSSALHGPSGLNRPVLTRLVLVCSVHSVGLCMCADVLSNCSHFTTGRSVGARILECRLHLSSKDGFQPKDMDQIEQLATEQLQSCQKYPLPRPGPSAHVSKFVYWLAFDTCLRGEVSDVSLSPCESFRTFIII